MVSVLACNSTKLPPNTNPNATWRESIYYHYYDKKAHGVPPHYGVRNDRYKLICFEKSNEWELFDLKTDPHELTSEYTNPEYKMVREQMHNELEQLRMKYQINVD